VHPYSFQNDRYGAHICGEGGEYETLTLDSPLFRKKIQLRETEVVTHVDSGFASVYFLRVKEAELVDKPVAGSMPDWRSLDERIKPPLLEEFGRDVENTVSSSSVVGDGASQPDTWPSRDREDGNQFVAKETRDWVCLSNVRSSSSLSLKEEAEQCFAFVKGRCALSFLAFTLTPSSPATRPTCPAQSEDGAYRQHQPPPCIYGGLHDRQRDLSIIFPFDTSV
jgi:diphthine-ammonia ligase